MAARAERQSSTRIGPVTLAEALERRLPHCDNDPHKVADQLDTQQRRNDIRLLGGGVVMSPGSNPSMLGIKAHIPPDGRAVLYVQIPRAFDSDCPVWEPGEPIERLERHHQFWAFDRTTFEAHFPHEPSLDKPVLVLEHEPLDKPVLVLEHEPLDKPVLEPPSDRATSDEPKNRGGHPEEYDPVELLTEAFIYVTIKELPKTVTGQGGLYDQLKLRLGSRCPERAQFSKIFGPIFRRIKNERSQGAKPAAKPTHPLRKTS